MPPEPTYRIVRMFQNDNASNYVVKRGLTEAQAQAHCSDTSTSSRTATHNEAVIRTETYGAWFDGYELETPERVPEGEPFVEYVLQGKYGRAWEDLSAYETAADAQQGRREYRENEGGTYRIQRREGKR